MCNQTHALHMLHLPASHPSTQHTNRHNGIAHVSIKELFPYQATLFASNLDPFPFSSRRFHPQISSFFCHSSAFSAIPLFRDISSLPNTRHYHTTESTAFSLSLPSPVILLAILSAPPTYHAPKNASIHPPFPCATSPPFPHLPPCPQSSNLNRQ